MLADLLWEKNTVPAKKQAKKKTDYKPGEQTQWHLIDLIAMQLAVVVTDILVSSCTKTEAACFAGDKLNLRGIYAMYSVLHSF
jgi:hypothetical protein